MKPKEEQKTKPVVHFIEVSNDIEEGRSTLVWPVNHKSPLVSNTTWAVTSPVVSIVYDESLPYSPNATNILEFETHNTIYRRQQDVVATKQ